MPVVGSDLTLRIACAATLAWVDAIERDDGTENLDQLYWHWVALMRAAVADAKLVGSTALPADSGVPRARAAAPRRAPASSWHRQGSVCALTAGGGRGSCDRGVARALGGVRQAPSADPRARSCAL